MVLWVGGPSASGKSFGASAVILSIQGSVPKDPSASQPKIGGDGAMLFDENGEPQYDEPGNDVVSIDGGVEREVSQMRQMVLQVALTKGYVAIKDLHKNTKLGTKKHVKKAATVAPNGLSMVIPDTFADPLTYRNKCRQMRAYEKDNQVEQYFSLVDGAPGHGKEFQTSTFHSGNTRANYRGTFGDKATMNNTNIGCESKDYDPGPFRMGKNRSKAAMEYFKSISHDPDNHNITFIQDLVHIAKNQDQKWEICTKKSDEPTHKMSRRDFESFQEYLADPRAWAKDDLKRQEVLNKVGGGSEPNQWLQACRKQKIAATPLIKTDAELTQDKKLAKEQKAEEKQKQGHPKQKIARRHALVKPLKSRQERAASSNHDYQGAQNTQQEKQDKSMKHQDSETKSFKENIPPRNNRRNASLISAFNKQRKVRKEPVLSQGKAEANVEPELRGHRRARNKRT